MIFVDGENLVLRFEDMVRRGWVPRSDDFTHVTDTIVWHSSFSQGVIMHEVLRPTYYTYVVGDTQRVGAMESQIRHLHFAHHRNSILPTQLTPRVFKKDNRSARAKGVDIAMVVDILGHVHANNVDTVLLLSGDGDYVPLIAEIQRACKQCYVSAFSDGLNPRIRTVAASFYCLDLTAFSSGPAATNTEGTAQC